MLLGIGKSIVEVPIYDTYFIHTICLIWCVFEKKKEKKCPGVYPRTVLCYLSLLLTYGDRHIHFKLFTLFAMNSFVNINYYFRSEPFVYKLPTFKANSLSY